ncbi:sugar ABC transporter ATP-binding protein [Methylovirgula sp. 4M-Z18]|uniref:sugar ABC transporter ATP-binding protein n=1 Tax=Methylovirgula sp. 4M-Z18 TaxID=2293567 RepID=UPI000E2FC5CD|nr:sugar ABC transporter ATP-binding protein [Methylovirgula sp. 4M-Z18]RFB79042.1 sugar ABC transporter ATP-binding protein [Methylovirgula sp. 4M-Z18]
MAQGNSAAASAAQTSTSPPLLHVEHVSKRFGGVKALNDVRFDIFPGEVMCLAGENGCGKSTLIKIITGVVQPDAGSTIRFKEHTLEKLSPAIARGLGIQVIWQDLALFPEMTVAENIGFERNLGSKPRLADFRRMHEDAAKILRRLGVSLDLNAFLRDLPIAQRQIVAIARALVTEARLIFMDEPTASLSQAETDALLAIVRRLSSEGISVVLVSHRLAEVLDVCTRVTALRDGTYVGTFPTAGMTQTRLTELMTGKTFDYSVSTRDLSGRPIVLDVDKLSRAGEYEDISFAIHAGEIVGLTGLLGAGRTELALTLFGMTKPSRGDVRLNGRSADFATNRDAIKAGVAYVSEDRLQLGLIQQQSIEDNTAITVLNQLLSPKPLLSFRKRDTLVRKWVKDLGIKIGLPENAISTLSGGNQQKVVLAKWLSTNPRLLILDSPTVGVDVGARAGIFTIVRRLADEGMAILLISDEIPEVYFNADRILHMRDGRIVGEYRPSAVAIDTIEEAVHA